MISPITVTAADLQPGDTIHDSQPTPLETPPWPPLRGTITDVEPGHTTMLRLDTTGDMKWYIAGGVVVKVRRDP